MTNVTNFLLPVCKKKRTMWKNRISQVSQLRPSRCLFSLSQFHFWGIGYNKGVDMKRNLLERQLSTLRRERRAVELKAWADIVNIRKELRRTLEEYKDAIRRYRDG